MMLLSRLHVRGYRRLLDVDLEMRPFTVLIGRNGVGKTSLLEVLSLIGASAQGQLVTRLSDLGGIADVVTRDRATELSIALSPPRDDVRLDYTLRVEPRGQGHWIPEERLRAHHDEFGPMDLLESVATRVAFQSGAKLEHADWALARGETALSQAPKTLRLAEDLRSRLAATTFYASLNVSPRSPVRLPQQMRPATLPGAQGEDLVACLYSLRESDPDRFEVLHDTLSAAFPDFEKLSFPPVAAGVLAMTWKDRSFEKPLYMHQLSEGTLRFLWLAALLSSRDLPPLILLDEPEVSLHPEMQSLLVELFREASKRSQIVVATHSDRLVRFLKPEELLVAEAEEGVARFTWADEMNIEEWLADYSLDELWRTRRLGEGA